MKKNFIYLLLLFTLIAQAQVTPSYPTIKLTKTVEGVKQDSLLVIGTDKTVKHIPYSKISSVQEFATASALPVTGIAGKIYITKDNNKIYTWNGTYYAELTITDISGKVDKIVGKGLSTEDYTTPEKTKLAELFNYDPTTINDAIALKVDKVPGKSLLSDTEITRLATLSNYTHPTNHPPSIITQDLNNRFVTDAEKSDWNNKQIALGFTPENVANKSTELTASSTLYPNNNAVIAGLATKSNDNAVVHLAGTETITGVKTFNDISAVTNYKSSTSSVIISDTDGLVFRGVRSGAWSDSVNTRFFQVGNSNDNVVFNTRFGSAANRMLFSSLKTQISSGNFVSTIVPLGIFEVTNGTNRFFNVFGSGNSVFGGSPDDNINRLQVTGTVSSGTTELGNTPPTANNQLTRKDYVDTGLALKANLASPALTGTPTAPTATAGTNTTQIATTAFVNNTSNLKEDIANKQNNLAVDGTGAKYVTVDAINSVIVNETTGVFSNIQTLVNSAQLGTTINLKPNTIYAQDNSLILKSGITLNGNGATLKRNAQQTTTTTVSATEVSTSITVSSVPVGWKAGDYLQLYTNDTYLTSSRKYEVIISSISGNVITLLNPIGAPASGSTYTWAIGATVRKVFSQITSQRSTDLFTTPTNWTVNNLIIDGNKSNNVGNFYWGVNMAVQNNGKSTISNITFKDIPNECVFGSGFTIKNSTLTNSNGSFLHQSADVTVGNSIFGGEITGNTTINTNIKDGVNVTGHSEAVITFSFSSGRTKISNNRFLGGSGSVMGRVVNSYTLIDGSLKDFIFTNNYCDSFTSIFDSFAYSASGLVTNVDNVLISNNTFNNCGVNDFGIYSSQINSFGKIKIYDNILNGNTTILNESWKLSFDKTIRKEYVGLGTSASPFYDKIIAGGIKDSHESGIYFGNSLGENNGTFIKLSTNPTGASSAPNDALIIKPNGDADFIGKITAASYTATSLPVFENNAVASSLAVGQFYRTSTGVLMVKF